MKDDKLLFKWCECEEYLRPVRDGACIEHGGTGKNETEYYALHYSNRVAVEEGAPEFSACEGSYDIEKVYFDRVKAKFCGVCVGFRTKKISGYIGVDTDYDYGGRERTVIFKHPKEMVDCAIVYFASGQKRFVPMESIRAAGEVSA